MKEQAIVIFIPNNKTINDVRKKYDRFYREFKNHVTLVYPFKIINQKQLNEHIRKSLIGIKQFKIVLKGLKKSKKDFYLYLLVQRGKKDISKLYNNLHSKLLTPFKNKDMPKYVPHLTLGSFENRSEIDEVIRNTNKKKLKVEAKVNEIFLLTFKKGAEIERIKRFKLR